MSASYLIVVGTSAGGMPALEQLVAGLPATLPAAVLVVQHFAATSDGQHLVNRLARRTPLACRLATNRAPLENGTLYLAPPDHHLLAKDGPAPHVLVSAGPRENSFRPSIDALFRSAAVAYGPHTVGIVLTGMLHDGTAGLEFIKRCGGVTVVQDPAEAEFPSMPETALRSMDIDYVVPLRQIGPLLDELTRGVMPEVKAAIPEDLKLEAAIAERVVGAIDDVAKLGHLVPLTCPDCGGSLWEMAHGRGLRYRCHTGHAYSAGSLLSSSQQHLDESLWVALRMMEERKNLLTSLAGRMGNSHAVRQVEQIEEIKRHVNRLRTFLLDGASRSSALDEGRVEQS